MALYAIDGIAPRLARGAWVAGEATLIGQVELGQDSSVWFGAVLRAENDRIRIGRGSNIQDGAVVHADEGFPVSVGDDVTVGHQAMLHGCTIGDGALIGIHAVVLNGAVIGPGCLVGAGAVVTEGAEFPAGSLIVGTPAKLLRVLNPEQIARVRRSAQAYVAKAARFRLGLVRVSAVHGPDD